jgi:hypothetical protein
MFLRWLRWLLISSLACVTAAWGANTALSSLSAASSVAATDLFYDVQTPGTGGVKATAAKTAAYTATAIGYAQPASYYVSSNWYLGFWTTSGTVTNGAVVTANTIYCTFGWVTQSVTIKALGAWVQTGATSSNTQFAVYSESGGTLTLVDSTASVASATNTTAISQTVANTTDVLKPNTVYAFCSNSSAAPIFADIGTSASFPAALIGSATLSHVVNPINASSNPGFVGVRWAATLGTWASTKALSATTDVTNATTYLLPIVAFQVN